MARFEAELASVSGAAGAGPQREVGLCFLAWLKCTALMCCVLLVAFEGARLKQVGALGASAHYPHAAPDIRHSQGAPLLQRCWGRNVLSNADLTTGLHDRRPGAADASGDGATAPACVPTSASGPLAGGPPIRMSLLVGWAGARRLQLQVMPAAAQGGAYPRPPDLAGPSYAPPGFPAPPGFAPPPYLPGAARPSFPAPPPHFGAAPGLQAPYSQPQPLQQLQQQYAGQQVAPGTSYHAAPAATPPPAVASSGPTQYSAPANQYAAPSVSLTTFARPAGVSAEEAKRAAANGAVVCPPPTLSAPSPACYGLPKKLSGRALPCRQRGQRMRRRSLRLCRGRLAARCGGTQR